MWKHRHHDSANAILAVIIVIGMAIMIVGITWFLFILVEAVLR